MSFYTLNASKTIIEKCRFELDKLKECPSNPEYDFLIFSIITGLNQLFVWYLKDDYIEPVYKDSCISYFNPFDSPEKVPNYFNKWYMNHKVFPETSKYQNAIRKICYKEILFNKIPIGEQSMDLTSSTEEFNRYKYSIRINGEDVDLDILAEQQVIKWEKFIKSVS